MALAGARAGYAPCRVCTSTTITRLSHNRVLGLRFVSKRTVSPVRAVPAIHVGASDRALSPITDRLGGSLTRLFPVTRVSLALSHQASRDKCKSVGGLAGASWRSVGAAGRGGSGGYESQKRASTCAAIPGDGAAMADTLLKGEGIGDGADVAAAAEKDGDENERRVIGTFQRRLRIADIKGGDDGGVGRVGEVLVLKGWVRTVRVQKAFAFVEVNDGSTLSGMQVVVNRDIPGFELIDDGSVATGASITVEGAVVASPGGKQKIEIRADRITLVGSSDATTYPLQKKRHSFDYLRTIAHLRPRTNSIGAVSRVRNALAYATHQFFQDNGFAWVSAPIITASDCEGAGEQFCVTTLVPESNAVNSIPTTKEGHVDWSKDFFKRPAYLTVSGQLNAEIYATALSDVYTFGPTFRAENSNTSRHLAEFWMIEPELAFADLNDDMRCATAYLQHVIRHVMNSCKEDLEFFDKFVEPGIINRLTAVVESQFAHVTYTDAVKILHKSGKSFEFPVEWGCDLQSEHERYLTEIAFKGSPVIVTDYPKGIKAFYMRENDDERTVAAMDVLVPRIGELIGGSQREERLQVLERRLEEAGLSKDAYWWYLDLRRYGSVPHAGFGVGFERLVQFATGMDNIREVIPFPRYPGSAEF